MSPAGSRPASTDPRDPARTQHSVADILRFRMLMIAAGYEDGIDANALRADPVFKMALERLPGARDLCSQSTVSRMENLPDHRMLLRMGRAMVGLYCAAFAQVPKRITLDIDDTFDAVHGGQQLRLFNAHYDEYGFQPIVVFDGAVSSAGRRTSVGFRRAPRRTGAGCARDNDPHRRDHPRRCSRRQLHDRRGRPHLPRHGSHPRRPVRGADHRELSAEPTAASADLDAQKEQDIQDIAMTLNLTPRRIPHAPRGLPQGAWQIPRDLLRLTGCCTSCGIHPGQ